MQIEQGKQVELHFALKLADGQVVDSTFDRKPAVLKIGDGNLPDGFEELLLGLQAGDKKSFVVPPEKAFAQPNPNNIQNMKRSDFAADMELEVGMVVSFADANKAELPGVIKEFDDTAVVVDFNHPLAGKELTFDVEIIQVTNGQ
ncbi:FKBP-type peptidyl-prolyl cis-trans isomerase [Bermanella sp. WJH001]|uniref:FKBP-type peptidyl-prolyl cis-trans isomerase n=1 Tax=Bermanella sp. WJH001 TaxID=3048005 RepID=UPI0024BDD1E7|nr:FKBP-type peptidyl-prolyl cis-trans isomerase [Bermanella sp. WJH001]MDJ1539624.1 FKBP-type peptidyl-prolyl cis-trans isomerase [Bermanella sp. WJH001]